ncbi:RHS repeat domain-containing protein [Pseudomonas sp.]|uniref:RHS repeat domain-containing protein n=1 Tax=Pseudomonas sp. TaxID=306 RepID=UPI00262CAB0C|nr:RHS repeat-associated core domain-containing protein [Pseudomonas sp.]
MMIVDISQRMRNDTLTPSLTVSEPRGLAVRQTAYCQRDAQLQQQERVTRHTFDPAGRSTASWDARAWTSERGPNVSRVHSLTDRTILIDSVDAGWRLVLPGEAGQVLMAWDGRDSQPQTEYDASLRPLAITEQSRVVERFTYGSAQGTGHNTCNQLVRHDDPAGTHLFSDYGLLGSALAETRQFSLSLNSPDWPVAVSERDALLDADGQTTQYRFNALGEPISQTDAMGNIQRFKHTVAGQLKETHLQLADAAGYQTLVSDIRYNAVGQVERETAGNGVVTSSAYDPASGRLIELTSAVTGKPPLQQLKYAYDPVGNLLQIEDIAQPIRFFANQQIDPINRYRYDSLYQLIEASGREVKTGSSHGPTLPDLQNLPPDPNQMANYTQTYDYDAAGNLLEMRHVGAQSFTRKMRVASGSNRSLPEGESDAEIAAGFDANGNLQELVRGQSLSWDARNQLQHVTAVRRRDGPDDTETYVYDGGGQRCRKVRSAQTNNRTLSSEVRYLPGLEIRCEPNGETLHVITARASRNGVRVLHWAANKPTDVQNDQVRYSLGDHLGSSALELDDQADILSQESYYPFGGTAWWAAKSVLEANYKSNRYSDKERDATGLYYYGSRYYAPWLQRWINPDPAGAIQGLNLFRFVGNAPAHHIEKDGRIYEGMNDIFEQGWTSAGHTIIARGLDQFPPNDAATVRSALSKTEGIYQDALNMINTYPQESASVMRSYFGYDHSKVTPVVVNTWGKTRGLLSEYQGPWGDGKFVGVESDSALGFVNQLDFHGRIALNLKTLNSDEFTVTLGHEVSHLAYVHGFTNVGPSTEDYFYLFEKKLKKLVSVNRDSRYDDPHQFVSDIIMGAGLTLDYLSMSPWIIPEFIAAVAAVHCGPESITTVDEAISAFNRNTYVSAALASNNADSLALAAHGLHRTYQRKAANASLFNELLRA